jgi:hypothetical protein
VLASARLPQQLDNPLRISPPGEVLGTHSLSRCLADLDAQFWLIGQADDGIGEGLLIFRIEQQADLSRFPQYLA